MFKISLFVLMGHSIYALAFPQDWYLLLSQLPEIPSCYLSLYRHILPSAGTYGDTVLYIFV